MIDTLAVVVGLLVARAARRFLDRRRALARTL